MAKGTDIYIISGAINPTDLTADSEPNYDEWGPDDYWSCDTFVYWHQLNVQKYGKQAADHKFLAAFEIAFNAFGSYHQSCCQNSNFRNYFISQGLDTDTLFCSLFMPAADAASNVADAASSTTGGIAWLGKVLKVAIPVAAIGAGVWAFDKYVYPVFPRKKGK